jgi:hypothetical protein
VAGQVACDAAISRRLNDLGSVKGRVDVAAHVTAADRTALDAEIGAAVTGLTQLRGTIDADTTRAKLAGDCRLIVTNFRVYLVLIPKAHMVVAADRVDAAADALNRLAGRLHERITTARAKGRNVTSAQGFVGDIGVKVQAATSAVSGVPSSLLPLLATGYPGNRQKLIDAKASLNAGLQALRGAMQDARQAIQALNTLG